MYCTLCPLLILVRRVREREKEREGERYIYIFIYYTYCTIQYRPGNCVIYGTYFDDVYAFIRCYVY